LIGRELMLFFNRWQTNELFVNSEHIEKYSRSHLAGQLAEILKSVRN